MSFAVGSLVRARGREWVVLPETTDDLVVARPLGGGEDEVAGIYPPLERVEPASFALPDPAQPGDYRSCRLLRDALRLGFRSSAGPFRSFARLAVEPRPNSPGISVPLPTDSDQVVQAVFEGLLLRGKTTPAQGTLFDDLYMEQERQTLFQQWEASSEREKRSRTMFAQEAIKVEEVTRELEAARAAIGSEVDVAAFTRTALQAHGAVVSGTDPVRLELAEVPRALRDALRAEDKFTARFHLPVSPGQVYLTRTHPLVEGLANHVLNAALDPLLDGVARRCGAIRTSRVARRTTVLLVRLRFHIVTRMGDQERPLLAEDSLVLAFAGSPQNAEWLPTAQAEALLDAAPEANVTPDQATHFLRLVIDGFAPLHPHLEQAARARGEELLDAHRRVRWTSPRMVDTQLSV